MKYSDEIIQQIWEKARAYTEISPDEWREDECGAWINRQDYGRHSKFGWQIVKVTADGADTPENLRPFHHENGYDVAAHKPMRHITADRTGMPVFEHNFEPRNRKA